MTTLTLRNIGPIREVKEITLNRINVFMGMQSSGKSTIAKLISFCMWMEKEVATQQSLEEYEKHPTYFRERIESFHKLKGFFRPDSYVHYRSEVIDLVWENEACTIQWVDRYAYFRSKIAYIPSERNMVLLPEARKAEFGDTNIRSFLFDWFDARKAFAANQQLSVLNLGIHYYFAEGSEEDRVKGASEGYDILLSNASSGLQSVTPLVVMTEHLTKEVYKEKALSFEQEKRKREAFEKLTLSILNSPKRVGDHHENGSGIFVTPRGTTQSIELTLEAIDLTDQVLDLLFTTQNTQLIIEEPEQNLFPSTQRDLVYYLLQNGLKREGNRITLTTHSPYVLYALNNAMMAHLVKEAMPEEEYASLKCSTANIDPKEVSIYEIRDGYVDGVIQEADGLIANNYFDEQMKELMDDFYAMLNYYGDDTE